MMSLQVLHAALPSVCRITLQMGLAILVQSTLLIVPGLLTVRLLRGYASTTRRFLANTTLMGVLSGAGLAFCLVGRAPALWRLSLPWGPGAAIPHHSKLLTDEAIGKSGLPVRLRPSELSRLNSDSVEALSNLTPSAGRQIGVIRSLSVETTPSAIHGNLLYSRSMPAHESVGMVENDVHLAPIPAMHPPAKESGAMQSRGMLRIRPALCYIALTGLWITGTFTLLAWLALSYMAIWRLRRSSRRVSETDTLALLDECCATLRARPPLLLTHPKVRSPFLTGLWRPAIVLPAGYRADFQPEALRAVLAHELTHLAQHDCWWTLLARLCCALFWPNPLLWLLCRLREEASEEACDQAVLAQACSPQVYARCLLTLAERLRPLRPERAAGAGALGASSMLARRIERIMLGSRRTQPVLSRRVSFLVVCAASGLAVSGVFMVASATPKRALPPAVAFGKPGPVASVPLAPAPPASDVTLAADSDANWAVSASVTHRKKQSTTAKELRTLWDLEARKLYMKPAVEPYVLNLWKEALAERPAAQQRKSRMSPLKPGKVGSLRSSAQWELNSAIAEADTDIESHRALLGSLQARRQQAELRLDQMSTQFTDQHPSVQIVRRQIAALNNQIAATGKRLSAERAILQQLQAVKQEQISALAEIHQERLAQLQAAEAQLATLEAQRASLERQLSDAKRIYTPENPAVLRAQSELTNAEEAVQSQRANVAQAEANLAQTQANLNQVITEAQIVLQQARAILRAAPAKQQKQQKRQQGQQRSQYYELQQGNLNSASASGNLNSSLAMSQAQQSIYSLHGTQLPDAGQPQFQSSHSPVSAGINSQRAGNSVNSGENAVSAASEPNAAAWQIFFRNSHANEGLNLEFTDAALRNVVDLIRQKTGIQVAILSQAKDRPYGTVTLSVQNRPVDEVMRLVAKAAGADEWEENGIYYIGPKRSRPNVQPASLHIEALQVTFGVPHMQGQTGSDKIAYTIITTQNAVGKTVEVQLSLIADYYGRDGKVLGNLVLHKRPMIIKVPANGQLIGICYLLIGQPPVSLPKGVDLVKYHYEVRAHIPGSEQPEVWGSRSSDIRTLQAGDFTAPSPSNMP